RRFANRGVDLQVRSFLVEKWSGPPGPLALDREKGGPGGPPHIRLIHVEFLSFCRALFIIDPLIYLYTFVMGAASLTGSIFDKTGRFQHGCARIWSKLILGTSGIRVTAIAADKVDTTRPHVFCS